MALLEALRHARKALSGSSAAIQGCLQPLAGEVPAVALTAQHVRRRVITGHLRIEQTPCCSAACRTGSGVRHPQESERLMGMRQKDKYRTESSLATTTSCRSATAALVTASTLALA